MCNLFPGGFHDIFKQETHQEMR